MDRRIATVETLATRLAVPDGPEVPHDSASAAVLNAS